MEQKCMHLQEAVRSSPAVMAAKNVLKWVMTGFIFDFACLVAMWVAVIVQRINMPRNIFTRRNTRLFAHLSRVKIGVGVMLMNCFLSRWRNAE